MMNRKQWAMAARWAIGVAIDWTVTAAKYANGVGDEGLTKRVDAVSKACREVAAYIEERVK